MRPERTVPSWERLFILGPGDIHGLREEKQKSIWTERSDIFKKCGPSLRMSRRPEVCLYGSAPGEVAGILVMRAGGYVVTKLAAESPGPTAVPSSGLCLVSEGLLLGRGRRNRGGDEA